MIKKTTRLLTASILGMACLAGAVPAQDAQEVRFSMDDGGAAHINLSGKLRMLSQMVPASACQAVSGYGTDYAKGFMNAATAEFDSILNALEFGDPALGINYAQERRLTLAAIADVREAWATLHLLSDVIADGSADGSELANAMTDSDAVLKAAAALVVEEVAQYSNPAQMAAAESFLIDIAGRQRMLIQMISKTACVSMSDYGTEASLEGLRNTMGTFETTLGALQSGMESVGIRKPPTPEIAEGLAEVQALWGDVKPFLNSVLEGENVDPEIATTQFRALNEMMAQMNRVVGMYAATVG